MSLCQSSLQLGRAVLSCAHKLPGDSTQEKRVLDSIPQRNTGWIQEQSNPSSGGFVWFNLTHCHCPGQAAVPWWEGTKEISPRAQGHGDPSEHTVALRAVTDLMARTSYPCSQQVEAEAAHVFQNF